MSRRRVIRSAMVAPPDGVRGRTVTADVSEDMPRGVFQVMCLSCGLASMRVEDEQLPVEVWALQHTGLHPAHRRYRLVTESFWLVTPAPGDPHHG
ncbi:hypothetical protein [Streptomyces hainanensis]|uniref:DUF7848 domain-containing protein n=1 Tax=Streptomyces hainanensis TaxID=402648 RepID=A0A4R4T973_9ACTN|nr:hypothetical protein [Streptomyces hainanensis]TDC73771.1 hypothetical protein E1283_18125 [Streptomyces hainanensis]